MKPFYFKFVYVYINKLIIRIMKVFVKELEIGDIFSESGLTLKVVNVTHGNTLANGKPVILVETVMIGYNPKMFPKSFAFETNGECNYWKKADTKVNVKR